MATHSSILAWEIPRTEGPGGLLSMASQESTWFTDYKRLNKTSETEESEDFATGGASADVERRGGHPISTPRVWGGMGT